MDEKVSLRDFRKTAVLTEIRKLKASERLVRFKDLKATVLIFDKFIVEKKIYERHRERI